MPFNLNKKRTKKSLSFVRNFTTNHGPPCFFDYFSLSERSHEAAESTIGASKSCAAHLEFSIQDPEAHGDLECKQPD